LVVLDVDEQYALTVGMTGVILNAQRYTGWGIDERER
jgi:hypothetical protein